MTSEIREGLFDTLVDGLHFTTEPFLRTGPYTAALSRHLDHHMSDADVLRVNEALNVILDLLTTVEYDALPEMQAVVRRPGSKYRTRCQACAAAPADDWAGDLAEMVIRDGGRA